MSRTIDQEVCSLCMVKRAKLDVLTSVLMTFLLFQAECYHYLFDAAIKLNQLGLDWSTPLHGPRQLRSAEHRDVSVKAGAADPDNNSKPAPVSLNSLYLRVLNFLQNFFASCFCVSIYIHRNLKLSTSYYCFYHKYYVYSSFS